MLIVMKTLLWLEMAVLLLLSVWLFSMLDFAWWWFLVLFLVPDIGMVGYAWGPKLGAWTYNLTHHLGLATLLIIAGAMLSLPWLELAGIIMLGHSAFDRTMGYGLKYPDSFHHTHLGWLRQL
jgi:hypothetical protein